MKRVFSAKLQPNQYVVQLGRYIYNNIKQCYQFKSSTNETDCYIKLKYTIDEDLLEEGEDPYGYIDLNLNIVTYQDKLRVNIYDLDGKYQRLIGSKIIKIKQNFDLQIECNELLSWVVKKIGKEYEGLFEFEKL